jgi:hypothetical protein
LLFYRFRFLMINLLSHIWLFLFKIQKFLNFFEQEGVNNLLKSYLFSQVNNKSELTSRSSSTWFSIRKCWIFSPFAFSQKSK